MDIKRDELKNNYFKTINGVEYHPSFTYEKFEDDTFIGVEITKTSEEVYQEKLNTKETVKEPTIQEQINAQLLGEIAQQKIVNAQLMQEIATLKGGNTNV